MKKLKRIVKFVLGAVIFLTLPSLLFFGFLYFKYNEDLPSGIEGPEADKLAYTMLNSLDFDAYKSTNYIEFSFKKRHFYRWNKAENNCEVFWRNIKVELDLGNPDRSKVFIDNVLNNENKVKEYVKKAQSYFNNDTFWLVAPYKVFDPGVERRIVTSDDGKQSLLVTYTSGGSTPGDSYLWHFDDSGKPTSFQMWVDILPIDGLKASWTDWTTTETGAQLPTFHKLLFLGLEIEDLTTK